MNMEAVKMVSWETSVPEDVYLVLLSHGLSQEAIAAEARKLLGIKLYATRILSLGKAARLAGLSKWDFIDLLGENNVPIIDYSAEKLDLEFENLTTLEEELDQ
jgi:predicted HTH domain antitoxin